MDELHTTANTMESTSNTERDESEVPQQQSSDSASNSMHNDEIQDKDVTQHADIDETPRSSIESERASQALRAEQLVERLSRILKQENISPRELGVYFSNLRVTGLGKSSLWQPTVGSVLNPARLLELFNDFRRPSVRDIISGFTGVIKPGEMLLVLGRPNAGCTTLLKTLANHRNEFHTVEGDLHFESFTPKEIAKLYKGDVLYCSEEDEHFPTLTVEQTLKLAATLRAPANRGNLPLQDYADIAVDYLTEALGLGHTKKTLVGDASIRGISGGEKRRTSIAELLAGRPCIGCWDNATRGLDSSNAIELVRLLRAATKAFNLTTIMSLYQAGDALFEQFDKVCILYEGRMAYFGPVEQARQYFIDMGYMPAPRQTTPDFLLSVTDPNARLARPSFTMRPSTAAEFADYFIKSALGSANETEISNYREECMNAQARREKYIKSVESEHRSNGNLRIGNSPRNAFIAPLSNQVSAVMRRQSQRLMGNITAVVLNVFFFVFQAVIMGTVFLNSPEATSAFFSRGGVLFFALLFSTLMALTEIPSLYTQRPIVVKQQKAAFYHPWIEALSLTLVDLPLNFVTVLLFSLILYFLAGLQRSAAQFFIFFLFVFLIGIVMKTWFRLLAAAFRSKDAASSLAGVTLLLTSIYTGYYIPRRSMIGALRWITYINPFLYGFEAITSNEFRTLNGVCTTLVPQGPRYENVSLDNQVCAVVGAVPGQLVVQGGQYLELSYSFTYSHVWRNLGITIGFASAFLFGLLAFTQKNTATSRETSAMRFKRPSTWYKRKKPLLDEEKLGDSATEKSESALESSAIPSEHVFSFDHISYTVPTPDNGHQRLLDDISGYVKPGKLTALMGESGAGKTTLLNLLAMRHSTGLVQGSRCIGGTPLPMDFQRQIGYCEQIDTHLETATVREALIFSAKLRQAHTILPTEKEEHVQLCLRLCGLETYQDVILGSLNLELRKRASIAVELAAKPKYLLFLDEPTSGLDSQSAWSIVSLLRKLSDAGQAILCTIHQPSAELFQAFDKLLLIQRGGRTVYFGDLGTDSRILLKYFERYSSHSCGANENPAEYIFSTLRTPPNRASGWSDVWKDSTECAHLRQEMAEFSLQKGQAEVIEPREFATTWPFQVTQLTLRSAHQYWRDPNYIWAKLVMNIVGGLLIGFTFFMSGNSQQDAQNKLFAIFMAIMICGPACLQLQTLFIHMRNIYQLREMPGKMYSWSALLTSQLIVEIPWNILSSFLFFVSWYWAIGFLNSRAGYTLLIYCLVFPMYYTTLAQAAAAMAPNVEIAGLLFTFFFSFVVTFNGVLQPFAQLGWWRWMYRVSAFTYVIDGLLGQAIGHQPITCSSLELVRIQPPGDQTCQQYMDPYMSTMGGYLVNPNASQDCQFCSTSTTDQFLFASFNIEYSRHWMDFGIIMGFVIFNIAAIYAFTYARQKRYTLPSWLAKKSGV